MPQRAQRVAQDWSREEVAATVTDYLLMLDHELRGVPYNKAEHNRSLQRVLDGRSGPAIEFKHANISAVLVELGLPYIDGYKPRGNYQELLKDEVVSRLAMMPEIERATRQIVEAPAEPPVAVVTSGEVFVPAPRREKPTRLYDRKQPTSTGREVNYLERESRNASLGLAGELFVLQVEHRRLWDAGKKELADKVEHVAKTQGDGLGYDIASFELSGKPRLIEVKTTNFGEMTPFFASTHEVLVSESLKDVFNLYRVFKFRSSPKIFELPGSLRESCLLDPVLFRATLV